MIDEKLLSVTPLPAPRWAVVAGYDPSPQSGRVVARGRNRRMYETRHQTPLTIADFARRLVQHLGAASVLLVASLGIGIVGYMVLEKMAFLDALLNAAMLLGGMGPVNAPVTAAGKVFASAYALYSGLVFIAVSALLFTPVLHRMLHHFHWDE